MVSVVTIFINTKRINWKWDYQPASEDKHRM